MGKEVKIVPEDELNVQSAEELYPEVDLVVSMGGDHTFLRA